MQAAGKKGISAEGASAAAGLRPARISFRELEPRIAFDAAMGAALADMATDHHEAPPLDPGDHAGHDAAYGAGSGADVSAGAWEPADTLPAESFAPAQPRQIVFVDSAVEDADILLRDIDAAAEIVWLDPRRDGVEQMAEALEGRTGIESIHVIAHGSAGSLNLGSATLDLASMRGEHADELATIGAALADDGDFLVYGCDFGAGESGLQAVQALAALTGADVAASDDITGHASLGGDWELEIRLGAVEAQIANFGGEDDWRHTLDVTPLGGETLVNASTAGNQSTALGGGRQVAVDDSGDHVVVWQDAGNIFARKFDADGTAIGGTLNVNTAFSGDTWEPAVATNNTGAFVVVWTGNSADNGIRAQLFSPTGAVIGSEIVVNAFGPGRQNSPSVAMNSSGFTVVWTSAGQDGSGTAIVGQRFDMNGVKIGGEFIVNTTTAGSQVEPTVAMNDDGDVVVAWSSADGDFDGVYARLYNSAGAAVTGEIAVNITTTGLQNLPSVAIHPSGEMVVTWTGDNDGSGPGIYARRFDAAGAPLGGEFLVNTYTLGEQAPSNVAVLPDGGFVIQWSSDGQDGGSYGQYYKIYNSSGVATTGDLLVNTTTAGGQIWGDVAAGGNRVISVWSGNGVGDADGVFMQRYSTNAAPSGIEARPGVTASELLADYEFDAANDLGRDDSGDGADLTLFGAPTQTAGPSGDGALYLTGGDYAQLPAMTTGGAMTVAGSVRFDSTGNFQRVFDFGQASSGGIGNIYVGRFGVTNNLTFTIETLPGVTYRATAAGAITNGTWLHFVATVDVDGTMSLYVNGVLADVEAGATPTIGNRDFHFVGRSNFAADAAFDGAIDNFFVAEGAVTATEALAIYNQTTGFSVAENSANGTVLGTVVGSDPDAGGALSYSLTDDAGGRFAIDPATGEITVANGLLLDFEASPTHTITVQAQDAGGLTTTQAFTITLANVNDASTGAPAITGIVAEDQTLTADTSGIADDDGVGAFSYQWLRNGVAISGATASTYTLVDADVGAAITVAVSHTDGGGNAEGPLVSAATAAVSGVNDAPVNTLPGTQTTAVNTPLILSTASGTAITVADVDASTLQVTLTATNGTLRLSTVAGLTFSVGDGVDDATMAFTGSPAAINTALNGLRFDPATGFQGNATIQIVTNDLGATGSGGALSDTDTLNIQVGALRFQEGVNGYTGTQDTFTSNAQPATAQGALDHLDADDGAPLETGLIRFDNLFGTGPGQIPTGSTITAATLSLYVLQIDALDTINVHRMLGAWSEASTHNSLVNGVQTDGVEAAVATVGSFSAGQAGWVNVAGLASVVQQWANGAANNGFALVAFGADNWRAASSEYATAALRPYLTISYTPPQPPVVTPSGSSTFAEGGPAVAINSGLTLSDADSTVMTGATVRITNYIPGQDSLQFTNQSGITGSWDNATGTLTLSGSASLASYQTALRSITYSNASDAPDPTARLVEISVDDQYAPGAAATVTVNVTPTNDAPTGLPAVTGTVTENQTLGVNVAGIADADGLGTFSYQWLCNGVAIAGATASTYTLGDADVGRNISVRVSWTDGYGTAESLTSAATAPVANVNDAPAGLPVVTGTATENQTLGVNTASIADNDGLGTFSYQWLRNGVAIGGATAPTYTLGDADVGATISVRVSYTDGNGTAETLTSAATAPVANVNDAPTGLPIVTGTATENQTLGVNTASIADNDGLGAFSYQWLRSGVAIGGATASTYTLGDADVGAAISVRVSYTDGNGTAETLTSAATAPVANVNDAPTGLPVVTGTANENQTLTADTAGIADNDGLGAFSYQWLRNGIAIGGATASTYTLGNADVGAAISVRVSYTDGQGTAETLTSAATGPVGNVNDSPTGLPVITGTATEDQTLGVNTAGIADNDGLGAFSYQWLRNGVAIGGATASTYTLGDADVGAAISVRVSYTDGNGTTETLTSAATAPVANVNDAPTGLPVVTGTANENQTLGVNTAGIADNDGLGAFSYQWLRNGVAIGGATASTYTLGDADVGAAISVRVSYTDGNGTAETLTSAATAPVANVNDAPTGLPVVTGTATENQTLTADTAGIADNDGLGAFSYQWLRNGVAIGGATASTYTLGDADVGQAIAVRVSWTDGQGTAETLTSAATAPVGNVNDSPTGLPVITGAVTEDQTLGVNTAGIADADGLGALSYQWLRNGVAIPGATAATYTLGDVDVGQNISVRVSWTDAYGAAEAVTSAATAPVANVNDAPVAVDDFLTVAEDSVATLINLLGNDTDIDGNPLSVSNLAGVAITPGVPQTIAVTNGALQVAADGSIRFTPATDYSGPVVFAYTVSDGQGGTDTGSMTITVTPVDDTVGAVIPPAQTVAEDNPLVFSTTNGNAIVLTDPDGTLGSDAIVRLSIPAGTGTLTLGSVAGLLTVAGNGTNEITMLGSVDAMNLALQGLTFVPAADWNGAFNLSVNVTRPTDVGFLNSGFEDPDFADADAFRYVDQALVPGWQTTATDNWIEVWDGGHQGLEAFDGDQFVELNADQVSTLYQTFTPGTAGGDLTLTFAHRGRLGVDTMNVTATDLGADGLPGGGDDVVLFSQDYSTGNTAWAQYLAPLGTASGNPILLQFNSISAAGGNQAFGNFLDAIDIFDSTLSNSATIAITVTAVADGVGDAISTAEDTPASFNVLTGTNGASADSFENPSHFVVSVTQPANGAVVFAADGTLTYTPDPDFHGVDTFTYTVESPAGVTETILVTMNVTAVNDAPTGLPAIAGFATEDQTLTANTAGIADADGLGAFSYQWFRDGAAIAGATASTYTLGDADVGTSITVAVSYVDADGTAEGPLVSAATAPVANVNDAPAGLPVIVGTATEDQTLTADVSAIADNDGLGAFSYQWLRNGVAIGGATASTYTLGDADVGAAISVRVSWTDAWGTPETLLSAATPPVANVNDAPTGLPLVVGTATEDQTLTADVSGIGDNDGLGAFSWQWLRNGVAITGATASTYTLGDADVGTAISVRVSWTDGNGTAESLTSAATAPVANVNDAPAGVPIITGTVTENQTLIADISGIADNDGLGAFSYQWFRNGVAIAGATASTYTLGDADISATITVAVTYTDGWGTAEGPLVSAATAPVANVNDAPTGLPVIVGTVTEDQTLTADVSGISDNDGLGAFSYQWLRDGAAIAGATASSYTLGNADVGAAITVQVRYTDGWGTTETLLSAGTAPVANVNDVPAGIPAIIGAAVEDQTLTADVSGISDNDGLGAFSYQWLRNGVAIPGATASDYTLGDADVGTVIAVAVTYTDFWGTAEGPLVSAGTVPVANVNDVPAGVPAIVGIVTEDQTLTADVSGISDNDGLGVLSYQWYRDGVAVAGATAASYTLGDDDVNARISVAVSWIDGWGTAETVVSAQSAPVANVNDAPVGAPVILGDATEDRTLTADISGISDNDGLGAFSYQWFRDGVAIAGATAQDYTLGDDDVGAVITVEVGYTDGWGTAEGPLVSAATAPVANVNDVPRNQPVIVGIVTEDETLTADVSAIADDDGLGAFSYQWYRDGVAIAGANAASYTLGDDDVAASMSVAVSWIDGWGTAEEVVSDPTAPVVNVNDNPVVTSNGAGAIATLPVPENSSLATVVTSFDVDGGAPVYQIVGGADASRFTLDPSSGELRFVTPPNFEGIDDANRDKTYEVTVRVDDGFGGFATQSLFIVVTDVDGEGGGDDGGPNDEAGNQPQPVEEEDRPAFTDPGLPEDAVAAVLEASFKASRDDAQARGARPEDPAGPVSGSPTLAGDAVPLFGLSELELQAPPRPEDANAAPQDVELSLDLKQLSQPDLWKSFDQLATDVLEDDRLLGLEFRELTLGGSVALTAGIVAWALRGGVVASSLLLALPALHRFDPILIVLARKKAAQAEEADSAVDTLFDAAKPFAATRT